MARPRSFDEHQVLEQCRDVFCEHGYDATSIDDLVAATGLKRGSLYQAFGSKHGIFLKVLRGALDATTNRFSDDAVTLVAIACLELAPHDAKVRDIIAKWRSQIPPEHAALLPQALGDNLLNRAGISAKPTTD
ncbi:TetR/AcrR family transcriptional regulator [Bifidobacterium sp. ESL0790]|uniref:TetR/AcrR family transcriptional regulator n=1 Tax=Bifidobacterium sp. ESL0790 TaxID=2983233 RepID=UPI0023F6215B|nr:TetR/AcrR family transcriptional regulator [Bifidobacterium sp. ESL0790]WEV73053.1 TetR/AcrR family transcriptional regulator [Bifidobacterium sp. ESL0790]